MDELHLLAKLTNAAAIAVTDTWLDDTVSDNEVHIPGYTIERRDSTVKVEVCAFLSGTILLLIEGMNLLIMNLQIPYQKDVFVEKLRSVDWCQVIYIENVCVAWKKFCEMFLEILDSVAPIKTVRLKQRSVYYSEYKCLRNNTKAIIK